MAAFHRDFLNISLLNSLCPFLSCFHGKEYIQRFLFVCFQGMINEDSIFLYSQVLFFTSQIIINYLFTGIFWGTFHQSHRHRTELAYPLILSCSFMCDCLRENPPPQYGHKFEYLIFSWWNSWEGLGGVVSFGRGVLLEVGFEISKA